MISFAASLIVFGTSSDIFALSIQITQNWDFSKILVGIRLVNTNKYKRRGMYNLIKIILDYLQERFHRFRLFRLYGNRRRFQHYYLDTLG